MPNPKDDGLSELLGEKPARAPEAAPGEEEGGSLPSDPGANSGPAEGTQGGDADASGTGYLGNGRYQRKNGIVERLDVYVPPETAKALRVAAATREDPNGTSVSEILRTLAEKAGYM